MNWIQTLKTFLFARLERNISFLEEETTRMRVSDKTPHGYDTEV